MRCSHNQVQLQLGAVTIKCGHIQVQSYSGAITAILILSSVMLICRVDFLAYMSLAGVK